MFTCIDRPYEALVGSVMTAQLLVAIDYPKLGFHPNRGCLFDYNEDRDQLLPPRGEPFVWDFDVQGEYGPIDIYDRTIASDLGLVPANLTVAESFHTTLDVARKPAHVRYFFFVGTRQVTPSASALRRGSREPVQAIELEDAADGTVPIWSATLIGFQNRPVGGEHGTIYQNGDLRRTLGALLGKAGILAAALGVELAVRDPVVEPSQPVHAALTFAAAQTHVDGTVRLELAALDPDGALTAYHPIPPSYPIQYSGLAAEKLGVMFDAPDITGFYRVAYYPRGAAEPAASNDLIVQAPPD